MGVSKVLVVGGGITGCMLAIGLAQRDVGVELVEVSPDGKPVGHGITLQGNALAALRRIGLLDQVLAQGASFDNLRLRQADGSLMVEMEVPRTGGADIPATAGTLRSSLLGILRDNVYASGVAVRLGTTVRGFTQLPEAVDVEFSDGSSGRFDLVVGADGIDSDMRRLLGIDIIPAPVGMGIWRVVAPRPAEMDCAELYYGGPRYKAGYSPISDDLCYAYLLDEKLDRSFIGDWPAGKLMYERSAGYGGTWGKVRDWLADDTVVNYQWIESVLVPDPWHRGRVIVIGDAAHACPPMIAQGAALCAEDAVILAELVTANAPLDAALDTFMRRRLPRVSMVVENSLLLADWEKYPETPGADPARVMSETLTALQVPA